MTTINTKIIKTIARHLDDKVNGIINWIPAKIISYNPEKSSASVKPLIDISDGEGGFIDIPIIPSVKVARHACGSFTFKLPFQEGDIVRLIFTNVGLDGFDGKQIDEDTTSKNSLTNCFVMPSEYSSEENSFEVNQMGELDIKMKKRITLEVGSIKILTSISDQMGKIIQGLTQISTALTALGGDATIPPMSPTPQPLTVKGAMIAAGVNIGQVATEITTLKQNLDKVI